MNAVDAQVVENAIGIEIHKRERYKVDQSLDNMLVLLSAYNDGDSIVPIRLEIKKFKDKQNTLYVAISLDKTKMTEVWKQGNTETGVTQNSRSVNISIAEIFKKINPYDKSFIKCIPKNLEDRGVNAKQARTLADEIINGSWIQKWGDTTAKRELKKIYWSFLAFASKSRQRCVCHPQLVAV